MGRCVYGTYVTLSDSWRRNEWNVTVILPSKFYLLNGPHKYFEAEIGGTVVRTRVDSKLVLKMGIKKIVKQQE